MYEEPRHAHSLTYVSGTCGGGKVQNVKINSKMSDVHF